MTAKMHLPPSVRLDRRVTKIVNVCLTLNDTDIATIIKHAVGAPDNAEVSFYCPFGDLRGAVVTYKEQSDGED